jgi:hypothetical protein
MLRKMEPEAHLLPGSEELRELVQDAALLGLKLESGEGARILGRILNRHLRDLAARFQTEAVLRVKEFLAMANRIPITLEVTEAQSFLFTLMQEHFPAVAARAATDPKAETLARHLVELMEALHFSPVRYLKLLG